MDDWVEFYRERRIRHQLQLLGECLVICHMVVDLTQQSAAGTFFHRRSSGSQI
jgi:fructosamine-3-kinase